MAAGVNFVTAKGKFLLLIVMPTKRLSIFTARLLEAMGTNALSPFPLYFKFKEEGEDFDGLEPFNEESVSCNQASVSGTKGSFPI